jgi:xanthine dehydrogenase accessory factor
MSELIPVLEGLVSEIDAGRPAALCAVVRTRGSTPQTAGAAMLLRGDFRTVGTLGGGCVEAEVRRRAFELLHGGQSALMDFLLNHDYGWDDGLICGGRMYIAVSPFMPGADIEPVRSALDLARARKPASFPIAVEHESQRLEYRLHLEVAPTLLIAGAGHVGQALARVAVDLDFHVVVIDDRSDCVSRQRFGERVELIVDSIPKALKAHPIDESCFVVIVTRGHQNDHQALDAVIRRPAGYIGLIGSRRKSKMILKDIRDSGVSQELLERVHTPIGLPIGAITVPEIAVSIAAELVQVRRQRTGPLVEGPFRALSDSAVPRTGQAVP